MQVRRIVGNLAVADRDQTRQFYQQVLGLEVLMDHGWIQRLGSDSHMAVQLSLAMKVVWAPQCRCFLSRWMIWMRYC